MPYDKFSIAKKLIKIKKEEYLRIYPTGERATH
jgi:hypothetical protein